MEMPVISATGNRGFTLLELLIVLAILVLMASAWPLAAPRLFPAQQLRNEGQRLIATLREARMTARLTGLTQALDFLPSKDAYAIAGAQRQLAKGILAQLRAGGPANGSSEILFFPDGSSSGGIIDLLLSERSMSIEVGAITGRVAAVE